MMRRYSVIIGTGLTILVGAAVAHSTVSAEQSTTFETCTADIYNTMAQEQRIYRNVLFGLTKAAEVRPGAVRHLTDRSVWLKTEPNTWKSLTNTSVMGDTEIDALTETDRVTNTNIRRGLFEIRHAHTSELIPALTQSIRAFQCRLESICLAAHETRKGGASPLIIESPGCMKMSFPVFAGCAFTEKTDVALPESIATHCQESAKDLLVREVNLLRMAVAYDAGYRSLLQFAGAFEHFTNALRFPLVRPLWEAASVIRQLDRIPCFISQCDQ